MNTVKSAVKAIAGGVRQAKYERLFRKPG
jgi:hypothetical protein